MSKLYRVIDVDDMEEYGVKLGDICTLKLKEEFSDSLARFHSPNWAADGVWWLDWSQLEELVESN